MTAKQKIEQAILNSNKTLEELVKKYVMDAESCLPHLTLLSAHKTCLEANTSANIKNINVDKNDSDVKRKFDFTLKKEMAEEEEKVLLIMSQLENIASSVIRQCDKVWNVFRSLQDKLSFEELTVGSPESFSIASKIEAFDMFQRKFHDDHYARIYSFSYYQSTRNVNKLRQFWNISDLKKAHSDLLCVTLD